MTPATPDLSFCDVQIANFVVSSGILHQAWTAICELNRDVVDNPTIITAPTEETHISVRSKTFPDKKFTIVAFATFGQEQWLELSPILHQNHPKFGFLSTKDNPFFSINQSALLLFLSLVDNLHQILESATPLILAGHSLGGCVAALFTLWLLENRSPLGPATPPLCITFGSPLVGDDGLCRSVSKRQKWNSRFLHVIAKHDPVPRLFTIRGSTARLRQMVSREENMAGTGTGRGDYTPFGTFLFCSQLGCAYVDDPVSVMELMALLILEESDGIQQKKSHYGYGEICEHLRQGVLYGGAAVSNVLNGGSSSLRAEIALQLQAIRIGETKQHGGSADSLIIAMEKHRWQNYLDHKKAIPNHAKKLNEIKIKMAQLEWYKKFCTVAGMGYYDCYKSRKSKPDMDVAKYKNALNNYWKEMVGKAESKPMARWLYGGTTYRRMVEPLDIADYYKRPGNKNYRNHGRSHHYSVLEIWHEAERTCGQNNGQSRNVASSLIKDSCFWAYVEEAKMSLRELQKTSGGAKDAEGSGRSEEEPREELKKFENYVMCLIDRYEVSTEVFLEKSSFMQWWREYKKVLDSDYSSPLYVFMKNQRYLQYC